MSITLCQGVFSQYAWQYYKLGMNIMPVHDRLPLVSGFNQLWGASRQTEEELEYLVEGFPHANGIAVVCGKYTTVLDVDVSREDTTPDVYEALMALAPRTPMKRFGSKGMGFVYQGADYTKQAPPVAVELFGRGGYVVLPPSYHDKTGEQYRWVDTTLEEVETLPVLELAQWEKIKHYCLVNGLVRKGAKREGDQGYGSEGGRNIVLTAKLWAMVKAPSVLGKSVTELVKEIMAYDLDRFGENSWFQDPTERKRYTPEQFARKFVERSLKKAQRERNVVVVPDDQWQEPESAEGYEGGGEGYGDEPNTVDEISSDKMPNLIPKGGIMEAVADFITESNGYENHVLSLVGALGLCSVLAGHRVMVGRSHPNMFILCTAGSGVGKSAPQRAIHQALMQSANGIGLLGYDTYASVQAVSMGLARNRCRIDIMDECKNLFMANTTQGGHLRGVDAELCKIWSASGGILPAKPAVNKDSSRPAICCPYLSALMFSTPAAFHRYYSTMLAEEGFGSRALVLADFTNLNQIDRGLVGFGPSTKSRYSSLTVDQIDYWTTMPVEYKDASGNLVAYDATGGIPSCHKISLSAAAMDMAEQMQRSYVAQAAEAAEVGHPNYELQAAYLRAMEHHYKLMGAWVISQADEGFELGVDQLDWANKVFEFSLLSLKRLLAKKSLQSEHEARINRYKAWAQGKKDVEKRRFVEWVRRMLDTGDSKAIANFISILEQEELGHFEVAERAAPNGKHRAKWVCGS